MRLAISRPFTSVSSESRIPDGLGTTASAAEKDAEHVEPTPRGLFLFRFICVCINTKLRKPSAGKVPEAARSVEITFSNRKHSDTRRPGYNRARGKRQTGNNSRGLALHHVAHGRCSFFVAILFVCWFLLVLFFVIFHCADGTEPAAAGVHTTGTLSNV